jgi:hypothetical protein
MTLFLFLSMLTNGEDASKERGAHPFFVVLEDLSEQQMEQVILLSQFYLSLFFQALHHS